MLEKKKKIDLILKRLTGSIEPAMNELLGSYVDKKNREALFYQIRTGGKRLRPAIAIISCRMLGGKLKDVLYPAAGLEILHNYTLIVDDIIDNSNLRRGKETCWKKFGKSIAQCLGVDYGAAVFQAAKRSKEPILLSELFAKTLKTIFDGEILDIIFEQSGREEEPYVAKNRYSKITEKDYLKMVSQKTASLFESSSEVGGRCAQGPERQIIALKNFGFNLGIAFQIQDDVLDILGEKEKFGKKIGKDILERKGGNIVILLALKEFSAREKKRFLEIMKKKKITNKDIKRALKLIKKTKALEKACQLGKKYISQAKKNLEFLPQNKWNNLLNEMADFVVERKK